MSFTRRHYEEVARILRMEREDIRNAESGSLTELRAADATAYSIQQSLSRMFAADNPRFDPVRFDMACEPKAQGGRDE